MYELMNDSLDGLDLEVQSYNTEHQALQVLDQVIENS